MRRSRVQVPLLALAGVVFGRPEFNSSVTLLKSQLVCLPPVGVLKAIMFIWIIAFVDHEKPLSGSSQLIILFFLSIGSILYKFVYLIKRSISPYLALNAFPSVTVLLP